MSLPKIAIVTGANRGIGLATVRGLLKKYEGKVYLTSRDEARGQDAVASLNKEGLKPAFQQLDTASKTSINNLKDYVIEKYGGLDILVHNAGILYKKDDPTPYPERAKTTVQTNYFDTVNVLNALLPVMKTGGRVVTLSTNISLIALQGCRDDIKSFFRSDDLTEKMLSDKMKEFVVSAEEGKHDENGFDEHAYGMSKLGVNALTRIMARDLKGQRDILINCCCPGWVRTDMGGENAPFSPDQGAQIPLKLAMLPADSTEPNGELHVRRKLVKWYE